MSCWFAYLVFLLHTELCERNFLQPTFVANKCLNNGRLLHSFIWIYILTSTSPHLSCLCTANVIFQSQWRGSWSSLSPPQIIGTSLSCWFLIIFFVFYRWKTSQMPSVRQSVQSELQPDHPQQETHGIQAVRMWHLFQRLPTQGRPPPAPREPARHEVKPKWARNPERSSSTLLYKCF